MASQNSINTSLECLSKLSDYKTLPLEEFQKYMRCILEVYKLNFGLDKMYLDFTDKYLNKEDNFRKEIVDEIGKFITPLQK